jgi:hypothetical protein
MRIKREFDPRGIESHRPHRSAQIAAPMLRGEPLAAPLFSNV